MPRACLLLFLCVRAYGWQEPQPNPGLALVRRVRQRMAENIARLPNYTCLETIERSVRGLDKDRLLFRDRIHLEVAFIGVSEMFAWPGSAKFEAGLLQQLPRGGASATGGFGGWTGSIFGPSAPAFTYAGGCTVEGRRGSRYDFRVPLLSSTYTIRVDDSEAISAYAGFICVDPEALDVMMLEIRAYDISAPVAAASEAIRYGRTRIGSGDFLLPQDDELNMTGLDGRESRNLTRFTACRQYTSESSISFDTEHEAAPVPPENTEELELPAGISLDMKLETPITFETSAVGDPITARLNRSIHASRVSIPKGATVSGRIWGLEQYYEPQKYFIVSLEFSSLTFSGRRAVFRARLAGPRLQEQKRSDSSGVVVESASDSVRTETTGLDIDDSSPRFGVFRVRGGSLHLARGLRMIWKTQGGKPQAP